MFGALLYLRLTSFQNWLRSRLRRLRQPKYLVGAIVGVAYFYFFFFRGLGGPATRGARHAAVTEAMPAVAAALPTDWLPAVAAGGALMLLVFAVFMWVVPTERAALGFSEAEIAFLFPAPIPRRALVHFRLLSSQFRSLVGATIMMLFSNRWSFLGGNALTHAIGWWFIFSALNLHFSGAKFTLTRLSDQGLGAWRRRALVFALLAAVIAATIARLPAAARLPALDDDFSLQPVATWLVTLAGTGPLAWLLWPGKIVMGPFLAADTFRFLMALGPAILVIVAHYLWVVHTAIAFEDASVEYAEKRGARVAAWRSGDRRVHHPPTTGRAAPFRLSGIGRPEIAFFWKNLLSTWPYFNLRVFGACVVVIVAGCLWLNSQPSWRGLLPGLGALTLVFAIYTLVVGPQFARQDIRGDLVHAEILKSYPLAGWRIVLGELLTPVAILTGVLWLALLVLAFTFLPGRTDLAWLTPQVRIACVLGLAVNAPALVGLQLLVPSAAALLFPGWFQTSRTRGGGPEVVGQRMIFFFAQTLTMVLAILPAALVAAIPFAVIALLHQTGTIAILVSCTLGAILMLAVLLAEIGCGLWLLGGWFEKLDLSAELHP
ncbi:MAG: hypothetical protein HY736_08870 [Verrucomicrobia bacterium]|nr:hypothetical protein [Verrucomicrobiota bacterium]